MKELNQVGMIERLKVMLQCPYLKVKQFTPLPDTQFPKTPEIGYLCFMGNYYQILGKFITGIGGAFLAVILFVMLCWALWYVITVLFKRIPRINISLVREEKPMDHPVLNRPLDGYWKDQYCFRVIPSYLHSGKLNAYIVIMEDSTGAAKLEAEYLTPGKIKEVLGIDIEDPAYPTMQEYTKDLIHPLEPTGKLVSIPFPNEDEDFEDSLDTNEDGL